MVQPVAINKTPRTVGRETLVFSGFLVDLPLACGSNGRATDSSGRPPLAVAWEDREEGIVGFSSFNSLDLQLSSFL